MGREAPAQATKRPGRIRWLMAWLGFGPESQLTELAGRDPHRARRQAEAAERRATRRAERRERREAKRRADEEAKRARVAARDASERTRRAADAELEAQREAEAAARRATERILAVAADLDRTEEQAAATLEDHQARLAEIESRARAAESRAERARARVAGALERATEARAEAKQARREIGPTPDGLADIEAERRLHEQAERRLELECAELRSRLERLRARVVDGAREAERHAAETDGALLRRRGEVPERLPGEMARVIEGSDRRSRAIGSGAATGAKRVAAAERDLARAAERLHGELERRSAEEAGSAKAAMEIELAAARRQFAEARQRALAAEPRATEVGLPGRGGARAERRHDPLDALEASLAEGAPAPRRRRIWSNLRPVRALALQVRLRRFDRSAPGLRPSRERVDRGQNR
jgi:hypothetical protein